MFAVRNVFYLILKCHVTQNKYILYVSSEVCMNALLYFNYSLNKQ